MLIIGCGGIALQLLLFPPTQNHCVESPFYCAALLAYALIAIIAAFLLCIHTCCGGDRHSVAVSGSENDRHVQFAIQEGEVEKQRTAMMQRQQEDIERLGGLSQALSESQEQAQEQTA